MSASRSYMPILFILAFALCTVRSKQNDEFSEELFIKSFYSGHILNFFQFTTLLNSSLSDESTFTHYHYWPRSLGDVLSRYRVQELHLSLTQGLWRHDKWGYPPESSPPGAELWVWFLPDVTDVEKTWSELVEALSGLFCSSLNFMDSKSTVSPRWSFRHSGLSPSNVTSEHLRYSALPREVVCTENLTPWKKLLPCSSKTGLASLFNAVKLYNGNYHSLGVHVRPICHDLSCQSETLELKQTLTFVFDPTTKSRGYQSWDIKSVYGQSLPSSCPMASSSKIYVDVSPKFPLDNTFELIPQPNTIEKFTVGSDIRQYAVYDLKTSSQNRRGFNLHMSYIRPLEYDHISLPPLYTQRYTTGYGLEKGGITTLIHNTLSANLTVVYLETVPWFLRVYFNTLLIQSDGKEIKPSKIHYIPGNDRSRSYMLEVVLTLAPESVTKISFQFERAFLKWTEYPPDASHGFYVNSAVVSTVLPVAYQYVTVPQTSSLFGESMKDKSSEFFLRVHTETLLVSLPTPDFSMPYNVICLACTVVAIAFGSLHNLTTRRFKVVDPNEKKKGLLAKIKAFFKKSEPVANDFTELKENTNVEKEEEIPEGEEGENVTQVRKRQKEVKDS